MRLRACLGGLLLELGACAHLPERIVVQIDGNSIEIEKKRPAETGGDGR